MAALIDAVGPTIDVDSLFAIRTQKDDVVNVFFSVGEVHPRLSHSEILNGLTHQFTCRGSCWDVNPVSLNTTPARGIAMFGNY
jgi:hypothetical protein